jgi:chromosome segregation ATPase
MSHNDKIKQLEIRIQTVNDSKIRAETQLEELRKQRDQILTRLQEMQVDPNSLGIRISQLKQQLEMDLTNIEAQIPEGF